MSEGSIQVAARVGAPTCSFCKETIDRSGAACAGCGTQLHRECWAEARRCPTIGCAEAPAGGLPEQVRCGACAQAMAEDERRTCQACGVQVHPACAAMVVGCTTEGCDGATFVRSAGRPASSGRGRGSSRVSFAGQASLWRASLWNQSLDWDWLAAWARCDPFTRALILSKITLFHALPVAIVLMAMIGSVLWAPGNELALTGALKGVAWAFPISGAATAYAFAQGLVGIRPTRLHNGGLLTLMTAALVAGVAGMALHSVVGFGPAMIGGGLAGSLLGVRLFGMHVQDDD